jgi:hypothetical protein
LVILAVIVGVLTLAVRYRTERRESIDYLTLTEDVARRHQDMSEQLGSLFQGLGQEDRPALEQRLETLATNARDAADEIDEMVVARPVGEVAGLMGVATDSWASGIETLGSAIVAILDAEDGDVSADESLRAAFELIRLGDRAYDGVVAAVAELDQELVPTQLPQVSYVEGQYSNLYNYQIVADRLRLQGGLAEFIDVALKANTVPEPVSEDDVGIWTIPSSDTLSLEVTVSNTGNVVVERVRVLVEVQQVGAPDTFVPLGKLIPSIEPGKSEILTFENLEATPGEVYSISAAASVEGQSDSTDDNTFNLIFKRNTE